ncbi:ergothioneine biosynthesis protein EgtB [Sedimenticola hydrogenitrophicus]|uniref:ergothioneine biosynthesis protein EgtB n=1 Tax=Sedimenticola hydrogenitrophicus TaxID=2967975 RepID=UPI0023B12F69|nr:ergothioneine biosynthesis protein EgtB [Sedimenticola hydrogenitrophicus]
MSRETLLEDYRRIRGFSERLCQPLAVDDYQIQSITETSPPKWHLAHVSWFFETFVLEHFNPDHVPFDPNFHYLFNSYYYTVGAMHPRPRRGLLSRPTLERVLAYRRHVDSRMEALIGDAESAEWGEVAFRITLGLQHEQQHQELLLMDIKHNLSVNPVKPAYRADLKVPPGEAPPVRWLAQEGGLHSIGHGGSGFAYDNETPRHSILIHDHRLADRLVTNAEYLEFIEDGGYGNPALWLADGWFRLQQEAWRQPLYWEQRDGVWRQFTLGGERPLNSHEPVCHLSFYEADAYARWSGKRLPREEELELILDEQPIAGNFVDSDLLHPAPAGPGGQWYGDLWAWTASPYTAYPGFRPLAGSMGEYNGKFMSSQMVLRGGCCATSAAHMRPSYRNFFYPHERWMFSGLRLAEDA